MSILLGFLVLLLIAAAAGGVTGYVVGYAHTRRRVARAAVQTNLVRGLR